MDRTDDFRSFCLAINPNFVYTPQHSDESEYELTSKRISVSIDTLMRLVMSRRLQDADSQSNISRDIEVLNDLKVDINLLTEHIHGFGGVSNTTQEAHRKSVISFLWKKLELCAESIRNKQEELLERIRQKESLFANNAEQAKANVAAASLKPQFDANLDVTYPKENSRELTLDSELEFAFMSALSDKSDEMVEIHKKMTELSELMTFFTSKVMEQQEQCESLLTMAEDSTVLIHEANDQLKQAIDRSKSYRFHQLCFYIFASLLLLFLDQFL